MTRASARLSPRQFLPDRRRPLESPRRTTGSGGCAYEDPRLDVLVQRESECFGNQGRTLHAIIRQLGFLLAVLMGIGAVSARSTRCTGRGVADPRGRRCARKFGRAAVVISRPRSRSCWRPPRVLGRGRPGGCSMEPHVHPQLGHLQPGHLRVRCDRPVDRPGDCFCADLGVRGGSPPCARAARLPVTAGLREA
jgi:hypothetical protein